MIFFFILKEFSKSISRNGIIQSVFFLEVYIGRKFYESDIVKQYSHNIELVVKKFSILTFSSLITFVNLLFQRIVYLFII